VGAYQGLSGTYLRNKTIQQGAVTVTEPIVVGQQYRHRVTGRLRRVTRITPTKISLRGGLSATVIRTALFIRTYELA
jgi:hypothetical protein